MGKEKDFDPIKELETDPDIADLLKDPKSIKMEKFVRLVNAKERRELQEEAERIKREQKKGFWD